MGTMTVSRALNKPHMVSEAFRQRILKAVAKTGYVPNRAASGLASGGVALIPVVLPTLHHAVYVPLLDGLHSVLPRAGFEILVSCTEYMIDNEETLVADLLGWNPRGIVLSGIDHSAATRTRLKKARIPVIEVMDTDGAPVDRSVGFSHEAVGLTAANYLADLGRRNIVYAGTQVEIDGRSIRRIRGFQNALVARRLPRRARYRVSMNPPRSVSVDDSFRKCWRSIRRRMRFFLATMTWRPARFSNARDVR